MNAFKTFCVALVAMLMLFGGFTASAQMTATTPNYSGMWWAGDAESGWGMTLAHHKNASGDQMFGALFIYGRDGRPLWFTVPGGTFSQNDRQFVGTAYLTTGPSYRNDTFDEHQVVVTPAGSMSISFTDDTHALMTYTLSGVTVQKQIEKFDFFSPPYDNWPSDFSDMWWNPAESGWGFNIAHNGDQLFGVWYGYREDGQPFWFVVPGGTWTTSSSFSANAYTTTGPSYTNPTFNTNNVVTTPVGTATLLWKSMDSATFSFTVNCVTKTREIERLKFIQQEGGGGTMWKPSKLGSFILAAGIAGCSGGGGGGSSPPSVGPAAATVAITNVTPENGATNVATTTNPTLSFTVANGSYLSHTADWKCGGNTVAYTSSESGAASGTITLTPNNPLPLGATCQISWTVSGTPIGNPAAQITQVFTTKSTRSYTDKVYAIWTFAYPYAVTKTSVTPVINKTSYTTGNNPIFNCGIANKPLSDGKVLLDCQERTTLSARKFYIDPTKDTMYDYNDAVPADINFTFVQGFDPATGWLARAQVSDGWYFTTNPTWVLKFQYNQGGAIITVKAGSFATDGNINVLASFSY